MMDASQGPAVEREVSRSLVTLATRKGCIGTPRATVDVLTRARLRAIVRERALCPAGERGQDFDPDRSVQQSVKIVRMYGQTVDE